MLNQIKKIKPHNVILALAAGGIVISVINSAPPLFNSLDNFVLFASDSVQIDKVSQVSSGDLGSNGKIEIEKDAIINGNLFADKITLDKNATVNGNASFDKLKTEKETQILGTQTKPISLPIANLPQAPAFAMGTQDITFEGTTSTLPAGSYRNITVAPSSTLTFSGGTYNLNKLELKDNATLILSASAILNIEEMFRGHDRVSILPGTNTLTAQDLAINYVGAKLKQPEDNQNDDDQETISLLGNKDEQDFKDGKIGRPVLFGKNSFLNFKLLAPDSMVGLGAKTTLRGQILARKIEVGEGSVLSRKESFNGKDDPSKIVTSNGDRFFVNEILVKLASQATLLDAHGIAASVDGRLIGSLPPANIYKIEVSASTVDELNADMQKLRSLSPLVEAVVNNLISK